jgi:hypothetical protein
MSDGLMTPEQRLRNLEELEERQQRNQRRAARAAWGSVIGATVVLLALMGFASWKLNQLADQKVQLTSDIAGLQKLKAAAEQERNDAEAQRKAAVGALSNVPDAQRQQAIDKQFATAPQTAGMLPRIYMHTVDASDNGRAQALRSALESAGYVVLGIENVVRAKGLRTSDVRYYHLSEKDTAAKIAGVLRGAGEQKVDVNYLAEFEHSDKVRPNHFEIWLAHQSLQ